MCTNKYETYSDLERPVRVRRLAALTDVNASANVAMVVFMFFCLIVHSLYEFCLFTSLLGCVDCLPKVKISVNWYVKVP